jgi:hypothetical protein
MVKTKIRQAAKRRKTARPAEPSLPISLTQIDAFLKKAKVPPAQRGDLDKARKALAEILKSIYGVDNQIFCIGENPRFFPFS